MRYRELIVFLAVRQQREKADYIYIYSPLSLSRVSPAQSRRDIRESA